MRAMLAEDCAMCQTGSYPTENGECFPDASDHDLIYAQARLPLAPHPGPQMCSRGKEGASCSTCAAFSGPVGHARLWCLTDPDMQHINILELSMSTTTGLDGGATPVRPAQIGARVPAHVWHRSASTSSASAHPFKWNVRLQAVNSRAFMKVRTGFSRSGGLRGCFSRQTRLLRRHAQRTCCG